MAMGYEQTNTKPTERDVSRIEQDVELVKKMTMHVEQTTDRIIRHSRALGYFEPPSEGGKLGGGPAPVITTMAEALTALGRAIDHCSGSLNVYD